MDAVSQDFKNSQQLFSFIFAKGNYRDLFIS